METVTVIKPYQELIEVAFELYYKHRLFLRKEINRDSDKPSMYALYQTLSATFVENGVYTLNKYYTEMVGEKDYSKLYKQLLEFTLWNNEVITSPSEDNMFYLYYKSSECQYRISIKNQRKKDDICVLFFLDIIGMGAC